jgi:hypothetical protein
MAAVGSIFLNVAEVQVRDLAHRTGLGDLRDFASAGGRRRDV